MFSNYYEVRGWLENFIPYTYSKQNLGLERIEYLLKLLGNPEKKFKSILVGGTSGKGSTAFYIAKLLQSSKFEIRNPKSETNSNDRNLKLQKVSNFENWNLDIGASNFSGLKIGLHLSPHLAYIGERMQILESRESRVESRKYENESEIPVEKLIKLISEVKLVVEKIQKERPDLAPSYFEILVAASFLYFAQEKVDWAVVEVGLGGRLDATNVLQSKIAVITNVGLDHIEILGNSVEVIAYEKAGIIKKGTPIVTGATGKALKIIEKVARLASAPVIKVDFAYNRESKRAKEKKARLIKVNTQLEVEPLKSAPKDYLIIYRDVERYINKSFASSNFLLGLTTVLALGFRPSKKALLQVSRLTLPGRFEQIEKGVILDSAHNVDKVKFLIRWIKDSEQLTVNSQLILVIAFKKGKDWKKMVDLLLNNLPVKKVIATKFNTVTDTGRGSAVAAKEIAEYFKSKSKVIPRQTRGDTEKYRSIKVESIENLQEAVFSALNAKSLDANQLVLVTGSLYLVGEARTLWHLPEF